MKALKMNLNKLTEILNTHVFTEENLMKLLTLLRVLFLGAMMVVGAVAYMALGLLAVALKNLEPPTWEAEEAEEAEDTEEAEELEEMDTEELEEMDTEEAEELEEMDTEELVEILLEDPGSIPTGDLGILIEQAMNYTEVVLNSLSQKTVKQLTLLAKERGVRIPKRAKKGEIIQALAEHAVEAGLDPEEM